MVKAVHWTRTKQFHGEVTNKDFVLVEENISETLNDGGLKKLNIYLIYFYLII